MDIIIRQETKNDFRAVYSLTKSAFGQVNESELIEALRKSHTFVPELSLVAIIDSQIVGHILFTKIIISDPAGFENSSLSLAPLSVDPRFQRQGIGGQLIRFGLNKAKELGYKSVIVLGHEHYYPKFGFSPSSKWDIKAPYDVPENAFMGIELVENGLMNARGTVQYPKEFDNL